MTSKLSKKLSYQSIKLTKTPLIDHNRKKRIFYGELILSPHKNNPKPSLLQMVNYMEKQYNKILESPLKNEHLIQEKINSTNIIVNDFDASFLNNNPNKPQKIIKSELLSPSKHKKSIDLKINEKLNINIDQEIKELQKIYYHVDQIDLLSREIKNINENINNAAKMKEANKNINNYLANSYKFDDYASNINIYNHPKLYILATKNNRYSNKTEKKNIKKIVNSKEIPCILPEITPKMQKKNFYNQYLSDKKTKKEK